MPIKQETWTIRAARVILQILLHGGSAGHKTLSSLERRYDNWKTTRGVSATVSACTLSVRGRSLDALSLQPGAPSFPGSVREDEIAGELKDSKLSIGNVYNAEGGVVPGA